MRYVQRQSGHSGIGMTAFYAEIIPEENGVLANKIVRDSIFLRSDYTKLLSLRHYVRLLKTDGLWLNVQLTPIHEAISSIIPS